MTDETPTTQKTKRTRKPSTTKRVRQPKPQAILDIEKQAADLKAKYRMAQSSGGVLKRIREKMIPKLTDAHRQELFDEFSKTETPKLLASPDDRTVSDATQGTHERDAK